MNLKITQINYGLTINLGNYESCRIDFLAQVNPDVDDLQEIYKKLSELVNAEGAKIRKENK